MFPSMASCLIITVYMELWKLRQSYLTALCNQQYCFVHVHMHSDVLSFVFYLLIWDKYVTWCDLNPYLMISTSYDMNEVDNAPHLGNQNSSKSPF